jgi:outer membrane phospholipase A
MREAERLNYPTEFLTGNLAVYLLAQYWIGYGESLLSYNRYSSTARFGFSLGR